MTVLILTSEDDVTADMVIHRLAAMGTPVLRLDPADIPGRVDFAARFTAGGGVAGHIATDRQCVDLVDISSVWVRRPGRPGAGATEQAEWVSVETEHALYGALRAMGPSWMNDPEASARARHKLWQLRIAAEAGLRIPETLFTMDPADAERFAASGPTVVKGVSGTHPDNPPVVIPTARVQPGTDFSAVAGSVTCLQREVPKVADLRLTVVGARLFACYITPKDPGIVDWRWLPPDECTWTIGELPAPVWADVARYMRASGLAFAAFDFAITEAGEHWFLEANQGGQFGFAELATGAPISQGVAEWLTHPSPTGIQPPSQNRPEA